MTLLEIVWVQVLLLDCSGPTSLRFGLRTFFGSDVVHAQHLHKLCSIECSIILPVASDKRPVLALNTTGLPRRPVTAAKRRQPPLFDHGLHGKRTTDDRLEAREGVDNRRSHFTDGDWGKHDTYTMLP